MKDVVVQKYGGTSLKGSDRIEHVASCIQKRHEVGDKVVVVVSAMGGETDRLMELGKACGGEAAAREFDVLLSTGEQVTSSLLAMTLSKKGIPSFSMQGHQVPIRTSSSFGQAEIVSVSPQKIQRALSEGKVVVISGYQGVNDQGEITTLGRGGSDLTAVAVAAAIEANVCEICTDVPGVFTADPEICDQARPIRTLAYDEMLELASLGANVLQARSVKLAKRYMIPIRVRCTFDDRPGTTIQGEEQAMEGTVVSAISCDRNDAKISIRRLPDPIQAITKLFSALADAEVIVDVIVQDRTNDGETNLTFTVPRSHLERAKSVVDQIAKTHPNTQITQHETVAKVSAVGLGMRSHSGVAAQMFRTLASEGVEVLAVSTSDIKISCVIDDRYAELAVRSLHDTFGLAKEPN